MHLIGDGRQRLATLGAGGQLIVIAAGFIGILVFVLFTASIAGEFSQGTLRALLTRQARRARLMIGKLAALLTATAIGLAVALSHPQAPTQPPSRFSAQA